MQIREIHSLRIAIIGLGYVGLPVAVSFASKGFDVVGFDIDKVRLQELQRGFDRTDSVNESDLSLANLVFSNNETVLAQCEIIIVAVPTPVDSSKRPDLTPFRSAAELVGRNLKQDAIVVFESTVFPGATEEVAVPILEKQSGLKLHEGFEVGYSPERINPGDTARQFSEITKIVSASSPGSLDLLSELYGAVVSAGIHKAPSIKVAEASKVIENTQRDLNIALMNELSILFHQIGIDTRDVIEGASTKWNFIPFQPGLVGGHCIGVDPYYLTHKANEVGMTPQVILAGRGTNEGIASFIAGKVIQQGIRLGLTMPPRITVLGATYKANVPDTRNSKVFDLINELEKFGASVSVFDPLADVDQVAADYGITLVAEEDLNAADIVVLAVPHSYFLQEKSGWEFVSSLLSYNQGLVVDIPAALQREVTPDGIELWRL